MSPVSQLWKPECPRTIQSQLLSRVLQLLKPARPEPVRPKRSQHHEKPEYQNKSSPRSLQLEKACVQQLSPSVAKSK